MPRFLIIWSQAGHVYELHADGVLQQQFGAEDGELWGSWLGTQTGFSFQGRQGHLNVLKEARPRGAGYWYAYAYTGQRKVKRYLGKTGAVTLARLEESASLLVHESARPSQATEPLSEQINVSLISPASSTSSAFPVALLLPKLSPPCLPLTLIARERLLTRLDMALTHALTLLSASAGFGKTTLLSAWAAHSSHLVAWLSLEEQDNDPIRFWVYVIAALRTCLPTLGETALTMLQTPQPAAVTTALTALINDLVVCPEDVVLVLDDYQVIDDPAINHAFQFLLTHLPSRFHLVLASRVDPPFALSRLRAQGRVIEIRDRDLCFTREETTYFLTRAMGQSLAEEEVSLLEQRTEGWIAGLQLAALAMRERADHFTFVQRLSGSQRFILEYMQEEILERQPEALQRFLLQTAVLARLNASLCQAVTGEQTSQQMLETLERSNLFLLPLDEERQWYRFHSLFRDVLQARLQAISPELLPALHQRAAHWYDQQGNASEAIGYALAGADYGFAASLMEGAATHMWLNGEARVLHTWIRQLPNALLLAHARLALTTALYFLHQTQFTPSAQRAEVLAQIEQTMARLECTLRNQEDAAALPEAEERLLHNRLHLLRECITAREAYLQGDVGQMRLTAHRMLDLTGEEDLMWKMLPAFNLVMSSELLGDVVSLLPMLSELQQLAEKGQHQYETIRVMNWLSNAYLASGQLHQAYQVCLQAVDLLKQKGGPGSVNGYLHLNLATLYRMWNQLEEAQTCLHTAIHSAQTWQHMDLLMWGYCDLVQVLLAAEKQAEAEQALAEMERLTRQQQWEIHRPWVMAARVQFWLTQGNLAAAANWATHMAVNPQALVYANEAEYMVLARVYLALQRYTEVLPLLAALLTRAERDQRRWDEVHILALQVVALQASGETVQAKQIASRLLQLTAPEGYIRLYLEAGPIMQRVLQTILDVLQAQDPYFSGISLSYVVTLLAAFERQARKTASKEQQQSLPSPSLAPQLAPAMSSPRSPLTAREREVLHLLARGATNQDIAQHLVISLATAKKHVANILSKLDAENRTQAIAHAREYALL